MQQFIRTMKTNSAIITPVLAAGSVASPYQFAINIMQRLCFAGCVGQSPVFNPTFQVLGISQLSTGLYAATILMQGTIQYVPCGQSTCCTKSQLISQEFTLPIASATAPTAVTLLAGTPVNTIVGEPCQQCSRQFVSDIPLQVTVA
jgi:hypothetical protein